MNTLNLQFSETICNGQLKIQSTEQQIKVIPGDVHIYNVVSQINGKQYTCVKQDESLQMHQLQDQSDIYYSEYSRVLESMYQNLKLYSEKGECQYLLPDDATNEITGTSDTVKQITFTIDFSVKYNNISEYNALEQQLPYILNYPSQSTICQLDILEINAKYDDSIRSFLFGQQCTQVTITDYRHGVTRFILAPVPETQPRQIFSCNVIPYESARSAINAFRIPTISDVQIVTIKSKQYQTSYQNANNHRSDYNTSNSITKQHQDGQMYCFVPLTSQPAAVAASLLVKRLMAKSLSKCITVQQYHIMDVAFKYFYIARVSAELQMFSRFESPETSQSEKQQLLYLINELKNHFLLLKSTITSNTSFDDFIFFIQKQVQPYGCNFVSLDTVGSITENISIAYLNFLDRQEQINVMRALQITQWDKTYLEEKQQAVILQTTISELLNDLFGYYGHEVFDFSAFPNPIQNGQSFTLQAYWNQINGKSGQYEFQNDTNQQNDGIKKENIQSQIQSTEPGVEGFSNIQPHPLSLFLEPVSAEEEINNLRTEQLRSLDDYERFLFIRFINCTEMQNETKNALIAASKMQPYHDSQYRRNVMTQSSKQRLGQIKYIHLIQRGDKALLNNVKDKKPQEFLNTEVYLQNILDYIDSTKFVPSASQSISNIKFPLNPLSGQFVESTPRIVKDPQACDVQGSSQKPKSFYEILKPYYIDIRWRALFSWGVWLHQIATGQESLAAFDYAIRNGARNARIGISVLYQRRLDIRESPFSFTRALLRSKCLLDRSHEARSLEKWLLDLQEVEKQLRGTSLNVQLMNSGMLASVQKQAVEFLITTSDTAFFLNAASYLASIRHFGQKEVGFLIATLAPGLIRLIQQLFIIFGKDMILYGTQCSQSKGTIGIQSETQGNSLAKENSEQQIQSNYSQEKSYSPMLLEYIRSQQNVQIPNGQIINDFICTATHLLVSSLGGQTTPAILYCLETFPYTPICDLSRFLFNKFNQIRGKLQLKPVNSFIISQLRLTGWDLTEHLDKDTEIELLCLNLSVSPQLINHQAIQSRIQSLLMFSNNDDSVSLATQNVTPSNVDDVSVKQEGTANETPVDQGVNTNSSGKNIHSQNIQIGSDLDEATIEFFNNLYSAMINNGQQNPSLKQLLSVLCNDVGQSGIQDQIVRRNYAQYELLSKCVGPYRLTHNHFINYNAKLLNIQPQQDVEKSQSESDERQHDKSGILSPWTRLCEQCIFGSCTCSWEDTVPTGIDYDGLYDELDGVLKVFQGIANKKNELPVAQFYAYKTSGKLWNEWNVLKRADYSYNQLLYPLFQKRFAKLFSRAPNTLEDFHERLRAATYIRSFIHDVDVLDNVYLQLFTGFSLPLRLFDRQIMKKLTITCTLHGRTYTAFQKYVACRDAAHMPDYETVKTGCVLRITEKGLQEFIRINFQLGEQYLAQMQIGDIMLNIMSFKLKLTDIVVDSVSAYPPEVHFMNKDVSGEAIIPNITLSLKFQFHLQQNIYPYISDHGSGLIRIQNMFIQLGLQMSLNDECPGRYIIDMKNPKSSVDQIVVQMDGNLQLIYDSILYIITSNIQNNFDALIGDSLMNAVQQIITANLEGVRPISPTDVHPNYFYDQRFQQIAIKDQQFIIQTTGQLCMETSNQTTTIVFSGYYDPQDYIPIPSYYTNSHIQYNLNLLVFQTINNNIFEHLWDKNKSELLEAPKAIKFTNTGLVTQLGVKLSEEEGKEYDLKVFGAISFYSKYYSPNLYLMRAQYMADMTIECKVLDQDCTSDELQKLQQNVVDPFKQWNELLSFSYVNSNNIGTCDVLYLNEQWVAGDCKVGV